MRHQSSESLRGTSILIFNLPPGRILLVHLVIIAILCACSAITSTLYVIDDVKVISFFFLGSEGNLPTYFSTFMLLEATVLLGAVAATERRKAGSFAHYWLALALIFFFLATDETAQIHEKATIPLRALFGLHGALNFAWVLVGIPAVLLVGGYYLRFLRGIERRYAVLFVISGAIYVTGAVGFEMWGGWISDHLGDRSALYFVEAHLEETFEMVGVALFIYSLLSLMKTRGIHWAIVDDSHWQQAGR
jgi:hypothetical protein